MCESRSIDQLEDNQARRHVVARLELRNLVQQIKGKTIKAAEIRQLPAVISRPKGVQKVKKLGLSAAIKEAEKADPSKFHKVYKQVRKTTNLLLNLNQEQLTQLKEQKTEQKVMKALYQAMKKVAKTAAFALT